MAKKKDEKHASLRSKDFRDLRPSELTLYEFSRREAPANPDAFFNFRSPPNDWALFIQHHHEVSKPHLFRHALSLAIADELLSQRNKNLAKVFDLSEDKDTRWAVRDILTSWLSDRPTFTLNRVTRRRRFYQWNAWDKATHAEMVNQASETGVSASTLFVVYSTKSLATSYNTPHILALKERVVMEWDRWLKQENRDLDELLATLRH